MPKLSNRRQMLRTIALAGVGGWVAGRSSVLGGSRSPNEKLNVAVIGCGGQGGGAVSFAAANDNLVALCDVDERRAGKSFEQFPKAKKYHDFRKMLDEMHKQIDAVVVSTPDHVHAPASMMAMKLGKHVYCEKPLTHSVYEARLMAKTAAEQKVVTQMGTQFNSCEGYRRAVEIIQSGAIGPVREVHCWTDRPGLAGSTQGRWPQGIGRPKDTPPAPAYLKWDLWLGPAPRRPYHPAYLPFVWRGWIDFGTGAMGDMACHICNVAFWALKLTSPTTVEARFSQEDAGTLSETYPKWCIITYEFPAREKMPPVKLTWYDAGKMPPAEVAAGMELPANGTLFVGDKGKALVPLQWADDSVILFPKEKYADYKAPDPWLPRRPSIREDWVAAIKNGTQAGCHFGYAGPMTEAMLVGNIALRAGQKIQWDAANLRVTNCPEAQQYVNPPYRQGWTL